MTAIRLGMLLVIACGFTLAISSLPAIQQPAFVIPEYRTSDQNSEPVLKEAYISGNLTR